MQGLQSAIHLFALSRTFTLLRQGPRFRGICSSAVLPLHVMAEPCIQLSGKINMN